MKHEIADQPWVTFGSDLFSFNNKDYVILGDYTSKFFEISRLPNTEASTVIKYTKPYFHVMESLDNGPQFTSYEFKKISQEWDFKDTTSRPRYPKPNGFLEQNIGRE